jgi:DNA-binding transcriptional LysR family regulator
MQLDLSELSLPVYEALASDVRLHILRLVSEQDLNISQLAGLLNLSKPIVTKHIQKLESDYETVLFTRGPHLRLTWEGERMLDYAKKTIAHENSLIESLRDKDKTGRIKLPIGVVSARAKIFLPEIFAVYHDLNPNVILSILPCNHRTADTMLRTGTIDLCFSVGDAAGHYGKRVKIIPDELFFIVSRGLVQQVMPDNWKNFEKKQADGIDFSDTCRFPLILPSSDSMLRILLDRYFDNAGNLPVTIAEMNEIDIMFSLCSKGIGAGFVTKPHAYAFRYELRNSPILIFPIKNITGLSSLDITYNEGQNLPQHLIEFIQCSKKVMENMSLLMDDYFKSRLIR